MGVGSPPSPLPNLKEIAVSTHRVQLTLLLSALRVIASSALVVGLLTLTPAAQGRRTVPLSLNVSFSVDGTITVTFNGTPVGTTSGEPTIIPAGYYAVMLFGPGACAYLPLIELKGPGVNIFSDMLGGEAQTFVYNTYFLPNSTYTWRNDRNPAVVYTFRTSAVVSGTAPAPSSSISSGTHSTVSNQDLVGSAAVPFRGTLTGAVSAAGRLTVAYKGKSVTSLKAGRYTIAVTDKSSTNGFILKKTKRPPVSLTSMVFVGKRSALVRLTAGKWIVTSRLGKTTYSIVVS
jgi:hypothetical protein